jgi:hypothetical protein
METQNFLFDELETAKEIQSDNDMETVSEQSQRIVSYWYRGSMHIDPTQGNGKLAETVQE